MHLFAKFFLTNSFYLYSSPKFLPPNTLYLIYIVHPLLVFNAKQPSSYVYGLHSNCINGMFCVHSSNRIISKHHLVMHITVRPHHTITLQANTHQIILQTLHPSIHHNVILLLVLVMQSINTNCNYNISRSYGRKSVNCNSNTK